MNEEYDNVDEDGNLLEEEDPRNGICKIFQRIIY